MPDEPEASDSYAACGSSLGVLKQELLHASTRVAVMEHILENLSRALHDCRPNNGNSNVDDTRSKVDQLLRWCNDETGEPKLPLADLAAEFAIRSKAYKPKERDSKIGRLTSREDLVTGEDSMSKTDAAFREARVAVAELYSSPSRTLPVHTLKYSEPIALDPDAGDYDVRINEEALRTDIDALRTIAYMQSVLLAALRRGLVGDGAERTVSDEKFINSLDKSKLFLGHVAVEVESHNVETAPKVSIPLLLSATFHGELLKNRGTEVDTDTFFETNDPFDPESFLRVPLRDDIRVAFNRIRRLRMSELLKDYKVVKNEKDAATVVLKSSAENE